jgi:cytochrome c biogenesis protein CcmG, thiol:disulfide interchange protein DsbE
MTQDDQPGNAGPAPARAVPQRGLKAAFYLPLALFALLAGFSLMRLMSGADNSVVPSALIGAPAPAAPLGPLGDLAVFDKIEPGVVTVVNIWASWCAPCRQEHPLLIELSRDERFVLAGISYRDDPGNALGFLAELGNPFDRVGTDPEGRSAIEWGVYGVPETFIVGRDGRIAHKHVGPLTPRNLEDGFGKALEAAIAAPAP